MIRLTVINLDVRFPSGLNGLVQKNGEPIILQKTEPWKMTAPVVSESIPSWAKDLQYEVAKHWIEESGVQYVKLDTGPCVMNETWGLTHALCY